MVPWGVGAKDVRQRVGLGRQQCPPKQGGGEGGRLGEGREPEIRAGKFEHHMI